MFQKIKILPIVVLSFVTSCFVMQDAEAYTPEEIKNACEEAQRNCLNLPADWGNIHPCEAWIYAKHSHAPRHGLDNPDDLYKRFERGYNACDSTADKKDQNKVKAVCEEGGRACKAN